MPHKPTIQCSIHYTNLLNISYLSAMHKCLYPPIPKVNNTLGTNMIHSTSILIEYLNVYIYRKYTLYPQNTFYLLISTISLTSYIFVNS